MPINDRRAHPWKVGRMPIEATDSMIIRQNPSLSGVPQGVRAVALQMVGDCFRQGFWFSEQSATLHDMLLPQLTHLVREYLAMCYATSAQVEDMVIIGIWPPGQAGTFSVLALQSTPDDEVQTDDPRVLDYIREIDHVVCVMHIGAEANVEAALRKQLVDKGIPDVPRQGWMRIKARYITTSLISNISMELHLQGFLTCNTEIGARLPIPDENGNDRYAYVNYDPLLNAERYQAPSGGNGTGPQTAPGGSDDEDAGEPDHDEGGESGSEPPDTSATDASS